MYTATCTVTITVQCGGSNNNSYNLIHNSNTQSCYYFVCGFRRFSRKYPDPARLWIGQTCKLSHCCCWSGALVKPIAALILSLTRSLLPTGALHLAFAQGHCSSLVSGEWSAYLTCSKVPSAINNCTGLRCSNSDLNWTASLVVQPCTDPVVVVVNVTVAEGTRAVGFVFTELEEQQQDGVVVDMGRYRNASHIFVEVRKTGGAGGREYRQITKCLQIWLLQI